MTTLRVYRIMPFGIKLKQLRKERGWSQDVFANKIGIHGRHVGKYEIGNTMPNAETVIKVSKVFGVSIDYLLLDDPTIIQGTEIKDKELLKGFALVDKMEEEDKMVIKRLIDAFIKKQQITTLLHN